MNLSQTDRVLEVLKDGKQHTVPEIIRRVYHNPGPSSARLSARIWELRHKRGLKIQSNEVKDGRARKSPVWWYRLVSKLCK